MTTIFATDTPGNNNQNAGPPGITTGTRIRCNVAGNITTVRWWCPSTAPAAAQWVLVRYVPATDSAGTSIGSGSFGTLTPNAWNVVSVGPFAMAAGDEFVVEAWNSEGRYVNTANYFASDVNRPTVTPVLTGPADDSVTPRHNGRFNVGGAITFPTDGFAQNGYFVDVDFTASSSGATVNPATVAGTTTVGAPSVRTGETITGVATVAGVTSVGVPSVRTGETVSGVSTVAGVTSVGVPSLRTGETVSGVATVAGTTTVGAPSLRTGETVAAATVTGTTVVPSPAVSGGATVTAGTVLGSSTVPTPTVGTSQGATVFAVTVAGHTTIPTPLVNPTTPTVRPIMSVSAGYPRWTVGSGYERWRIG